MEAKVKYIGRIHSSLKRLEDCPLQENENAPEATIEIYPEYLKGIKDIKEGSDLILLSWLDRSDRTILMTQPRNNMNAPVTGVFSTRSPDRPNPIGIHFVNVTSILGENKFKVKGLDVLDQTPVIDIKPDLKR